MKKIAEDLLVAAVEHPRSGYTLLKMQLPESVATQIVPGQFVEILVSTSPTTFLRRPISVNFVDDKTSQLWLLIHTVGAGTLALEHATVGEKINCLLPLGKGFTIPNGTEKKLLLVGGGVGTAPLLFLGKKLCKAGHTPYFLLGGRSGADILQLELFRDFGEVFITTEDGSLGEKGFVTNHSVLTRESFDAVATCGPKPMMVAVSKWAKAQGTPCEASLENLMACGLGACLCCVEKVDGHNVCVCKEGPVFNTERLLWLS